MKKLIMTIMVFSTVGSGFAATSDNGRLIMTNPLNLEYKFEKGDPVHRTCADPVIVLYHDKYFLFSSHASGYSYSDNLRDWTHMFSKMPLVEEWAPAVMVYDDYIYYMGFGNKRIFRTNNPIADEWEEVTGSELQDKGDPDFFVDNDGRTYYLWGCSAGGAMQGQEFDPATFKPLTAVKNLIPANGKRYGWEVPGDNNELTTQTGWNEGVSMVHEGDYYYFFYATPGTEYTSYCTAAYVSRNPLGPFSVMTGSPFAIKPAGFIPGGGHGHPFKDRYGNHWYVASLIIGAREHYERRIGIFPAYYNVENGKPYARAITDNMDLPFVVPDKKMDFETESIMAGMNLLSSRKTMTASTTLNKMVPENAADDSIRTWWSAKSGRAGEWLQMDLGRVMSVEAIQACFADEGWTNHRYDTNVSPYRYVIEGSEDGNDWHVMVDRSQNIIDQIYELCVLPEAEQVRYLRITNKASFARGYFSLSEFRVFGHADIDTPRAARNFKAFRLPDARRITMKWDPSDDAEGYIVRWGATPQRLDQASRVYTTSVEYGFFDSKATYYVSVQPFNEAGLGENSAVLEISPTSTGIQSVEAERETDDVFTSLSGIRTKNPGKGVYINGGRIILR